MFINPEKKQFTNIVYLIAEIKSVKKQKKKFLQVIKKQQLLKTNDIKQITVSLTQMNVQKTSFKRRNWYTACEKSYEKMG